MFSNKPMLSVVTVALLATTSQLRSQDFAAGSWVDLTHPLNEDSVFWPTAKMFEKETVFEGDTGNGYFYSAFNFSAAEHGGTHIDAPVHFSEGRHATDEIPVEQLVGPAVVIDVSKAAEEDRDYRIRTADIESWEKANGEIPAGAIVLFDTGFGQYYPDRERYMGTAARGEEAVAELHFPGIHADTATFLANERDINAVGIDTPSIDYGQSTKFESHVILYAKDVFGLENVANLGELPETGATVIALPMKIEGGSGGPVRIVAWLPDS